MPPAQLLCRTEKAFRKNFLPDPLLVPHPSYEKTSLSCYQWLKEDQRIDPSSQDILPNELFVRNLGQLS